MQVSHAAMPAGRPHEDDGPRRRTILAGGLLGLGLAGVGGTVTAEPGHAAARLLRRGSRGSDVRFLQQRMSRLGYWCGAADGVFGHLTQQAVWALQKAGGVARDGVVGPVTHGVLSRGVVPAPRDRSGSHVEIHLARQLLLVVDGGRTARVLNTSTGNGEPYDWYGRRLRAITPTGEFAVYSTYSQGWQSGPLGDLYRPQYFTGGIAVHGSEQIPPTPASHGCCRVSVGAMDMLWSSGAMRKGTPVVVA